MNVGAKERYSSCLPAGVNLDSRISVDPSTAKKPLKSRTTVREELRHLNARCKRGKLVDRGSRPIQFYTLIGCWGNPPEDYQEVLAKQEADIKQLERKYTVIRVPCQQTTDPRQIH